MKILFLAPELPWPSISGGRLRTAALIRGLSRSHEITLAAPIIPGTEVSPGFDNALHEIRFHPLPDFCRPQAFPKGSRFRRLTMFGFDYIGNRTPYTFRITNPAVEESLNELAKSHDAIFCRYTWLMPLLRKVQDKEIVLDADDINYVGTWRQALLRTHGWGSLFMGIEATRVFHFERQAYRLASKVLVCSRKDLLRLNPSKTAVLKNGIPIPSRDVVVTDFDPGLITWVGMASYAPNTDGLRWFLKEVWPKLKSVHPHVRFKIFGRDADAKALPFAVGLDDVELVGPVADSSLRLASGLLSVVPLLNGTGTRIKILESLACGRAVVSTDVGAEGYDEILEEHGLFRARDARSMVEHISNLISSPERAIALAANGRRLVEMNYSWEVVTEHLARDFERWTRPERLQSRGAL